MRIRFLPPGLDEETRENIRFLFLVLLAAISGAGLSTIFVLYIAARR